MKHVAALIKETVKLNVACTIEKNVNTLVTLDTNLIHNEKIEREFGIKIRHPNELL